MKSEEKAAVDRSAGLPLFCSPSKLESAFGQSLGGLLESPNVAAAIAAEPGPGAAADPVAGPWIAAFSGGCDSTALVRLLHRCAAGPAAGGRSGSRSDACAGSADHPLPTPDKIHAVHINHGLRGAEADADEEACRALAGALGFPYHAERLAPPANLPGGAIEKWARTERYRALEAAAAAIGATVVLTGHNRDDQAETVLLRLLHGAGFWGLAGIRPLRRLIWGSSVLLARPLLPFTREELSGYLREIGQSFRHDSTNEELSFQRNRIRRRLLPRLAGACAGGRLAMVGMLCELAQASRSLHLAIDEAAASLLDGADAADTSNGQLSFIERDIFDRAPEALRFGLLRLAAHRLAPRQVPLSRPAFDALVADWKTAGTDDPATRRAWDLGNGVLVRETERGLTVTSAADTCPDAVPGGSGEILSELAVPGAVDLPDGTRILARVTTDPTEAAHARDVDREVRARNREVLDADLVDSQLTIRYRRPGDVFHPLGAPGRRKLKSFLIDRKVPLRERDTLPLVCSGDTVIWVVGVRISEPARVTSDTRRFLLLSRTGR